MSFGEEINRWNAIWKLDFWWRKKYNVAFGSPTHLEMTQIDIAFDFHENNMYEKAVARYKDLEEKKEAYTKTGIWIKEQNEEMTDEDWSKFDLKSLSVLNK